jgi:hypothetical protein|tara:strand:+ start:50 stop:331 length:282 start_codon:yes stop_codon:yes gene_type:complete
MSGMFNPEGTLDTSKLENMTQEDVMKMIAAQRTQQTQSGLMQQAMQMQNQKMQGQAPAPQIKRGQAPQIMSPYEELMKLQQMQSMRQRPQSLL